MTWAKVGMKVVCVDELFIGQSIQPLVKGTVYEITGFTAKASYGRYRDDTHVSLKGVCNPFAIGRGFGIGRFRPLVTKTQSEDVAMFKRIADQVPNMEDVGNG